MCLPSSLDYVQANNILTPQKKTESPFIPDEPPCGRQHDPNAKDRYDAGKYHLEENPSYFKNGWDMDGVRCGDCDQLIVGETPKGEVKRTDKQPKEAKGWIKPTGKEPVYVCNGRNHKGKHQCFFCLCTPCFNKGMTKDSIPGQPRVGRRQTRNRSAGQQNTK